MEFSEWTKEKRKLNSLEELKKDIIEQLNEINEKEAIAMVSGGKDSSLAVALSLDVGVKIKYLVHFYHKWSWNIAKKNVENLSKRFNIPVIYIDMTEELLKRIRGAYGSGICRICKNIMKDFTADIAKKEGIKLIITGDTALERVSGAIMNYLREKYGEVIYNKMEITPVPKKYKLLFFRPLIRVGYSDILKLLDYYNIKVEKAYEVGDRSFWREGCCLQYADESTPLSKELFDELYKYNKIVTSIAKKYGFRASIKLPSKTILTVPDDEKYKELIKNELKKLC